MTSDGNPESASGAPVTYRPTVRVTLELDRDAFVAARQAAADDGVSLSRWLSKAAWERAIWKAAVLTAEQDRLHPEEMADWREDAAERIFGSGSQ
jgi:hypothetical protein